MHFIYEVNSSQIVRLRDDCFGDTFSPMITVSSSCVIYLGVIWCFLVKGHHMRVGIHGAFGHSFFLLSLLFGQLLSVVGLVRPSRPLSLYLYLRATHPTHTLSLRHPPNHSTAFASLVGSKVGNIF